MGIDFPDKMRRIGLFFSVTERRMVEPWYPKKEPEFCRIHQFCVPKSQMNGRTQCLLQCVETVLHILPDGTTKFLQGLFDFTRFFVKAHLLYFSCGRCYFFNPCPCSNFVVVLPLFQRHALDLLP